MNPLLVQKTTIEKLVGDEMVEDGQGDAGAGTVVVAV